MVAYTVTKTIGTGGDYSTPALWEAGAPASLTTAEKSACTNFLVAAFIVGETITFVQAGTDPVGVVLETDSTGPGTGTYMVYGLTSGNPAATAVITGGTSLATCVLTSGTPDNVGVIWQGKLKNQEFVTASIALAIGGSTTSSTAYKELTTVAGASFADNVNAQTNALAYNASNGAAIRATDTGIQVVNSSENNCRISKFQIAGTGTTSSALDPGGTSTIVDQMICESKNTSTSVTVGVLKTFTASSTPTIKNSIFIQRQSAADHIAGFGTANPSIYNCTFVAADDLATAPTSVMTSGASGTVTVQNCGLFAGDSTKAVKAGSATFNFTTCHSDISGTTGVSQVTYSSQFQNVNDATRDFRLKTGAGMIDAGTTDSTNAANDIVGTARPSGASYDTGCWELVAAQSVVPILMRQYRARWAA